MPELKDYENATGLGVAELWKWQAKRTQFASQYLKQWQDAGIDCLLCPTTTYAAVENGKFTKWVGYTGVFNVVDYSALSFPCGTKVDEKLDADYGDEPILSGYDKDVRAQCKSVFASTRSTPTDSVLDNASAIHGMPVSLQLVAQRLEEEKLLEMAKIVLADLT